MAEERLRGQRSRALRRRDLPEAVHEELRGAYFFALASRETSESGEWLRTVQGRVLPAAAVQRLPPTRMRGEPLTDAQPVAFVISAGAPVLSEDTLNAVGVADRYARFVSQGEVTLWDIAYVRVPEGRLIARKHVRLMRVTPRPRGVGADDHWVQVALAEQVLVAYRGDTPVFATLVASGIEGHETPRGLFQVRSKHVTTTMRGPDPVRGVYEVEEVPWTQYFSGDYALHGAYWHDAFGEVRSHGCVNVPPEDARWLFRFTTPDLPEGRHAMRGAKGSWVYITD